MEVLAGAFGTVMLALLSGVGGTILWEGIVRPRRSRKHLARVIAAEIGMNVRLLEANASLRQFNPRVIESDFALTRSVFDAVAATVAELPADILEQVLHFYLNVDHINRINAVFAATMNEFANATDERQRARFDQELHGIHEATTRLSKGAIVIGAQTIVALRRVGGHVPSFVRNVKSEDLEAMVEEIRGLQRAAKEAGKRRSKPEPQQDP